MLFFANSVKTMSVVNVDIVQRLACKTKKNTGAAHVVVMVKLGKDKTDFIGPSLLFFKTAMMKSGFFNRIKSHFIFSSVSACSLGGTIQQLALDSLQFAARLHKQTNG